MQLWYVNQQYYQYFSVRASTSIRVPSRQRRPASVARKPTNQHKPLNYSVGVFLSNYYCAVKLPQRASAPSTPDIQTCAFVVGQNCKLQAGRFEITWRPCSVGGAKCALLLSAQSAALHFLQCACFRSAGVMRGWCVIQLLLSLPAQVDFFVLAPGTNLARAPPGRWGFISAHGGAEATPAVVCGQLCCTSSACLQVAPYGDHG